MNKSGSDTSSGFASIPNGDPAPFHAYRKGALGRSRPFYIHRAWPDVRVFAEKSLGSRHLFAGLD